MAKKRDPKVVERFLKKEGLKKVPKGKEVDHKVPLVDGGSDTVRNLQLLTEKQHAAKRKARSVDVVKERVHKRGKGDTESGQFLSGAVGKKLSAKARIRNKKALEILKDR